MEKVRNHCTASFINANGKQLNPQTGNPLFLSLSFSLSLSLSRYTGTEVFTKVFYHRSMRNLDCRESSVSDDNSQSLIATGLS